jgi:hypothetical protein
MKSFKEYLTEQELIEESPTTGDYFNIEIAREEIVLETHVIDVLEDGVLIEADETMLKILSHVGYLTEDSNMPVAHDSTSPINGSNLEEDDDYPGSQGTWMHGGYKIRYNPETFTLTVQGKNQERGHRWGGKPTKQAYRIAVQQLIDKLEDETELDEAKYQGREVPLGKPMAGDVKKSKVYVRNPQGNVVKVNFGDKKMKIKKSNPKRRKSFRARHNCANPGPRHKARYWSCRAW